MSATLFYVAWKYNSLNVKIFAAFFFAYYFIPLPNISTYRGTITYKTLQIYTLMLLIGIFPLLFRIKKRHKIIKKRRIKISLLFKAIVSIHLFIVYVVLFYIYAKYGPVLLYQELRFQVPASLGYLVKSSIYIPLFIFFINREKTTLLTIFKYGILPLIPALFIGSRGTVILIVISVAMLLIMVKTELGESYSLKNSEIWNKYKKYVYSLGLTSLLILHLFYYTRRIFSNRLVSNLQIVKTYFNSNSYFFLLILPLYTSFRETIGIANSLIKSEVHNNVTNYPLFFSELITVLPGEQPAPGQIVGQIIGKKLEGGLTPNIMGGLYLDFGWYTIFGCVFFVLTIKYFYSKSFYNEYYKVLYVISITQFFHLFHRGFMKPEYLVSYAIILAYFLITRIKVNKIQRLDI